MSQLAWKLWHQVVKLREDVRTGELSLSIFAADLYDVVMGTARPVYQDPREFFALTYPTFNLRELAKEVAQRLAGLVRVGIDVFQGNEPTHRRSAGASQLIHEVRLVPHAESVGQAGSSKARHAR